MKKHLPLVILIVILIAFVIAGFLGSENHTTSSVFKSSDFSDCNVAKHVLAGDVYTSPMYLSSSEEGEWSRETYSEDLLAAFEKAADDPSIKALVLEVNSYGGSVVAGEEIANALQRIKKPTVAVIRDAGTSAAYWAATGADTIFASANSDVGSIGVMYSYLESVEKNNIEGLKYNIFTTGKYKSLGDPNVVLTKDAEMVIQRDLNLIYENFISAVSKNRNIPAEEVRKLGDGGTMLGQNAIDKKLVDKIGDLSDAKDYLADLLEDDVVYCDYTPSEDFGS